MGDLSTHFSRKEFRCHCGCGSDTIDAETLRLCEEVREIVGGPIRVLSGHRCLSHNRAVGSPDASQHVQGRAADLAVADPEAVYAALCRRHANQYGFGCYPKSGFVHVDSRANAARWKG